MVAVEVRKVVLRAFVAHVDVAPGGFVGVVEGVVTTLDDLEADRVVVHGDAATAVELGTATGSSRCV